MYAEQRAKQPKVPANVREFLEIIDHFIEYKKYVAEAVSDGVNEAVIMSHPEMKRLMKEVRRLGKGYFLAIFQ